MSLGATGALAAHSLFCISRGTTTCLQFEDSEKYSSGTNLIRTLVSGKRVYVSSNKEIGERKNALKKLAPWAKGVNALYACGISIDTYDKLTKRGEDNPLLTSLVVGGSGVLAMYPAEHVFEHWLLPYLRENAPDAVDKGSKSNNSIIKTVANALKSLKWGGTFGKVASGVGFFAASMLGAMAGSEAAKKLTGADKILKKPELPENILALREEGKIPDKLFKTYVDYFQKSAGSQGLTAQA